jgi:membrane protein implicated in regulation of membrane protease activity
LWRSIRPWAIFILTFILATILNFFLLSLQRFSDLKPTDLILWLGSIWIKLILFPLLPFLLLAAHEAFIRIISKAQKGYSNTRLKKMPDLKPEYAGKSNL